MIKVQDNTKYLEYVQTKVLQCLAALSPALHAVHRAPLTMTKQERRVLTAIRDVWLALGIQALLFTIPLSY